MPDIAVVFGNGAVAGEEACLGDVHKALLAPAQRVAGVIAQGLPLAHNIGIEVRQGLEPVLADQLIVQAGQVFGVTSGQHLRPGEKADGTADVGIALHPLGGVVIAHGIAVDDLIGGLAEDVDILFSHLLADLHVGTVHGAEGQRTVQHELHVAGAGSLLGSKADLLGQVAGRDQLFGSGNVVVLDEHDL